MSQAGIAPASGNFQAHGLVVGGVATGTLGQFVALPVSGNYGVGNVNYTMNDNEWSRFYLSSSFHGVSGSIIQAINYLKNQTTSPTAISGNVKINIFTAKILSNNNIETSGAFVAGTTMSGAGLVSANALTTEEATISVAGAVSGAGGGTFNALTTEEATISIAGVVSGAAAIQGQSLTIANASIISSAKALGNVTTISGASSIGGAKLTIGGTDVATQAGALIAPTTVSGAGAGSFKSLTTEEATISVAGVMSGSGAVQGQSLKVANIFNVNKNGVVSSSGGGTFLGNIFTNDMNVSGTLTAASFTPAAISGAVKINVFTNKILSNNSIETSASLVAKTTISGAGLVSANALTTEEATINVAGAYSGSGGIAGQSLTVANLFKVTNKGNISSSAAAHFVSPMTGESLAVSSSLVAKTTLSGAGAISGQSLTIANGMGSISSAGAGLFQGGVLAASITTQGVSKIYGAGALSGGVSAGVHFSNTGSAAGTGFKAALFISSSDITTSADAAKIPRMVLQGTDESGVLKDFMLTVSGGILQAVELTKGTWPV